MQEFRPIPGYPRYLISITGEVVRDDGFRPMVSPTNGSLRVNLVGPKGLRGITLAKLMREIWPGVSLTPPVPDDPDWRQVPEFPTYWVSRTGDVRCERWTLDGRDYVWDPRYLAGSRGTVMLTNDKGKFNRSRVLLRKQCWPVTIQVEGKLEGVTVMVDGKAEAVTVKKPKVVKAKPVSSPQPKAEPKPRAARPSKPKPETASETTGKIQDRDRWAAPVQSLWTSSAPAEHQRPIAAVNIEPIKFDRLKVRRLTLAEARMEQQAK